MRKTPILFVLFAAAAFGAAVGCGPETPTAGPTPAPTPFDLGTRSCPPGSALTWENFGEPFIRSQCLGCHSSALPEGSRQNAPVGIDFNTYDMVRAYGVQIFVDAADNAVRMPPAGGPTLADRQALGDWLACNAPKEPWDSGNDPIY